MKKNYTILLIAMLFYGSLMAQETQKNFINYQGVARNGAGQLMANETMTIGIALKMGSATGAAAYAENHSIGTDANGVFSIKIGSGEAVSGAYSTIPWGSEATFITILLNGSEIGTTEMMAVPYALSSGDAAQEANDVPYDNSVSGLIATNTQQAIDELIGSGAIDADADPANELQDISLSGTDLSISDGSTIDLSPIIPPGGTDDQNAIEVPFDNTTSGLAATDAQAAIDELATSGVVDTDDQGLVLTGDVLTIEDGSGSIDLSAYRNAADVTTETGILVGDGTSISGLVGTSDNQIAKWNNATNTWVAGTDETGGLSLPYYDEITETGGAFHVHNNSPNSSYGIVGTTGSDGATISGNRAGVHGYSTIGHGVYGRSSRDYFAGVQGVSNTNTGFGVLGYGLGDGIGGYFYTSSAGRAALATGPGNVGIGTQDPEAKLHVAGDARVDGNMSVAERLFVNTDTGSFQMGTSDGNRWVFRTTGANRGLGILSRTMTGNVGSQRVRFIMEHTGEFKFGGIVENEAWLHVRKNSTVAKPHIKIEETDDDDYARIELTNSNSRFWHLAGYVGNTLAEDRFNIYNSAEGNIFSVRGNGNVVINGSVAHSSDRRLKRDVITLPYGLKTVMQLAPKAYYWKKDASNNQMALGLIAQDVQPIIKEVVRGGDEEDDMLSISYTELVPVLIKAIQEQQELIQHLQREQNITRSEVTLIKKQLGELKGLIGNKEVALKK